ncbi:MAG: radical SAM protein [Candidatus Brocadiales bacterium]
MHCGCCGNEDVLVSETIGICVDCIRNRFQEVFTHIQEVHRRSREYFGLPGEVPRVPGGVRCKICVNECQIPDGGRGYCGVRENKAGRLVGGTAREGYLSWYHDTLPTNCVADWVCPGGTGTGYPTYCYTKGPEYGYKNLAAFYHACSFNCLFCQNWHYRERAVRDGGISASRLADAVDEQTTCICYFGGDPTPQLPHAITASRLALEKKKGAILRICWETNGTMHPSYAKDMARLSMESGGCIKFDLKAWSEELNLALCGVTNKRTLENFRLLAERIEERPEPPLLVASTLLIPGYVDEQELANIASFIASLNPRIPYALLAFHPQFYMADLPTTSKEHALRCKEVAEAQGLSRVRLGNVHLLCDS